MAIPELNKSNKKSQNLSAIKKKYNIEYIDVYSVNDIKDIFNVYLNFFIQEKVCIRKCANCGKYFIPTNRSDSKYCENPSPQNSNKTCRNIGATLFYKNSRSIIDIEHNRTKATLSKRISRCMEDKKELQKATNKYDTYIENYTKKQKKYKKGTIDEDEFKNWIIAQKQ